MKATVICNPAAGRGDGPHGVKQAAERLEQAGWSIDVRYSNGVGDATRLAGEAVTAGQEAVVAAGGDGTVNEVVQALAGTDVALGYLPYGTVNIWARELGIPLHGPEAADVIARGRIESVDVGCIDDRSFLLMAAIGFDAQVLKRASGFERYKQRYGVLPYVLGALATVPVYGGIDLELRYDGLIRRVHALMLVAGNTRLYGGYFHLTPDAVANDGRLDVCIVKGNSPWSLARQALPLLLTRSTRHMDVETFRVRELCVQASDPTPYQVDGELAGETPAVLSVAPRALRTIVPRDFKADLLS